MELIFALQAEVSEIRKLPLGMKLGHWPKCQSCTYTLFPPQGVKIELIFALHAVVSEIQVDIQNHHMWA